MQERAAAQPPRHTAPPSHPSEQEPAPIGGLHFPDLSIRGFRGIADLHIPQLGRVTLLTGKNNTGKSSILEALRLHTQNAEPHVVYSILTLREEFARGMDGELQSFDPGDLFQVSALFHGFPHLSDDFGPIVISTSGRVSLTPMKLTMRVDWFAEAEGSERTTRLVAPENALSGEPADVPVLVVETEEGRRVYRLETFRRYLYSGRMPYSWPSDQARMPCILVDPHSGGETGTLEHLWDAIALTDQEKDVRRSPAHY